MKKAFGVRRWSSFILQLRYSIVLVLALSGCASMGRSVFATPTVELKDLKLMSVGLQGAAVDVVLLVNNLNDYRLDATRLSYNLFVDSVRVFYGEIKRTVTLEANRKTEVLVPLNFSIQELLKASEIFSKTGGVDYRVEGEVTAATPGATFTRQYRGQGHFDDIGSLRPR